MGNYPTAICYFQKYMTWTRFDCIHPKRLEDHVECNKTTLCNHREMRRKCEIAKTYHELNIQSIDSGKVKYCPFEEDCKRKYSYPECNEEGVRIWVNFYSKDFEVK